MNRLGILLSGRGSNFLAIHRATVAGSLRAEIAVVLSNRAAAPGLLAARELGLLAFAIPAGTLTPQQRDLLFLEKLREYNVDLVCLAGYMRLLSPTFIDAYPNRILNIHPSLLPAFPGLDAQQQALEHGVKVTGCTVHLVDRDLDHGVIVLQRPVPVEDYDTPDTLCARILAEEHRAYPEAVALILSGAFHMEGRRLFVSRNATIPL